MTSADITTNFGVRVGSRKKRSKPLPPELLKEAEKYADVDFKKIKMRRMNLSGASHKEIAETVLGIDCPCHHCSVASTVGVFQRIVRSVQSKTPSEFGANYVYYFSSIPNAAGIIKWGQFAHNYATQLPNNLLLEISDQNVMNRRIPWHSNCCLYFGHHTPTQFLHVGLKSNRDLVFIRYNADNLFNKPGVRFSNGNLANGNVKIYSSEKKSEFLSTLKWSTILHEPKVWSPRKKFEKSAELIIPHYIEPQEIDSVIVYSQEHKDQLNKWFDYISDFNAEYIRVLQQIGQQGVQIPNSPRQTCPQIIVDRTLYF